MARPKEFHQHRSIARPRAAAFIAAICEGSEQDRVEAEWARNATTYIKFAEGSSPGLVGAESLTALEASMADLVARADADIAAASDQDATTS